MVNNMKNMKNIPLFILLVIIIILAITADYFALRRKRCRRQMEQCVAAGDYAGFCALLESKDGKRFFKGTDALLVKLDACLQLSRHEDIRALFAQLDEVRLPRGGYINYNMKKLAYAIDIKDASLAEAAWRALHKFRQSRYVLREADQLYDIYVCHKSNHIDELKNFAGKTKNPSSRAMAFFRIAKQYHYLGDADRRTEYLLKAKGAYNDPTWQKIIGDILAGDLSRLE